MRIHFLESLVLLALTSAMFLWFLWACTAAQKRAVVRMETDCQKLEANPATPNLQKYACEDFDLVVDTAALGTALAARDAGKE